MMAYQQGHVVSVIVNGQVKREQAEGSERTVRIPFDSEYALRIKNKTNYRSLVKVLIDGTVCAEKLLLRPQQSIDLERFVIDGDLQKGKRFKFVSLANPNVQDPTAGENGLIEVVVEPEVQYTYAYNPPTSWTIWNYFQHNPIGGQGGCGSGSGGTGGAYSGQPISYGGQGGHGANNFMNISSNATGCVNSAGQTFTSNSVHIPQVEQTKDMGATVEGSLSHQRFVETNEWFQTMAAFTIPIRLRGPKVQQTFWDLRVAARELHRTDMTSKYESFEVTDKHLIVRIPIDQVKISV